MKKQQEIGRLAYSVDRTKKNEIALIYDTESVHLVSDALDKLVLDFYRTSDIHRIGAPVDYYFHNDLAEILYRCNGHFRRCDRYHHDACSFR